MVSKVFPPDELEDRTLDFARRIAALPTMTALLIKESVNQTVDNMGFYNSLNACFTLHQLNHSHWAEVHEDSWPAAKPEDGIPSWKEAPPIVPAEKTDRPGRGSGLALRDTNVRSRLETGLAGPGDRDRTGGSTCPM